MERYLHGINFHLNDLCRYSLDGSQPEFDFFPSALLLVDWLSATEFLFAASCISVVGFLAAFRIMHEVGPKILSCPWTSLHLSHLTSTLAFLATGSTQFRGETNPRQVDDAERPRPAPHRPAASLLDAGGHRHHLLPSYW